MAWERSAAYHDSSSCVASVESVRMPVGIIVVVMLAVGWLNPQLLDQPELGETKSEAMPSYSESSVVVSSTDIDGKRQEENTTNPRPAFLFRSTHRDITRSAVRRLPQT
jgi:hypothetical protein